MTLTSGPEPGKAGTASPGESVRRAPVRGDAVMMKKFGAFGSLPGLALLETP
jgi:hypothetical protein